MLYNTNFGKLNNQALEYAPKNIKIDGTWYIPASEENLISKGWMKIFDTPYPTDGKTYAMKWMIEDNQIVKVWVEVLPPQSESELDSVIDLEEIIIDLEYKITLLELGVEE